MILLNYIERIPSSEKIKWCNEFVSLKQKNGDRTKTIDIINTFNDCIEHMYHPDTNGTRIILDYNLAISARDFIYTVLKREKYKIISKYPEILI